MEIIRQMPRARARAGSFAWRSYVKCLGLRLARASSFAGDHTSNA